MKFGESFTERSVPEWKSYNVDYLGLKAVVKARTTDGPGNASRTAAGTGRSPSSHFESEIMFLLASEIQRTSLFVKSKRLAIDSRLDGIDRQLEHVKTNHRQPSRNSKGLKRRFNMVAGQIQDVGNEIRLVSRFVSTNRTAVSKLVKKFVKWSGVESLPYKVDLIMNQPECFATVDLPALTVRYEAQLSIVRSLHQKHESAGRPSSRRHAEAIRAKLDRTSEDSVFKYAKDTAINFDVAIDATQRASVEHRAVYWVHPDNVLELRVLLIQTLRQLMPTEPTAQLIFDNPETYAQRCSSARPKPDTVALFASDQVAFQVNADHGPKQTARIETAQLQDFVTEKGEWTKTCVIDEDEDCDDVEREMAYEARQEVHKWVTSAEDRRLLAKATFRRTRFVDLKEGLGTNTRVTLDEDVHMTSRPVLESLATKDDLLKAGDDAATFPHAVLTVRYCDLDKSLVHILNDSHLTERVDDFSICFHSLYICVGAPIGSSPSWALLMAKDIRHVPSPTSESQSRKSSIFGSSPDDVSPRLGSRSSYSRMDGRSTPLTEPSTGTGKSSIGKFVTKPPRARFDTTVVRQQAAKVQEQRYWNEYQDGSEFGEDGDAFVIYVDPDAPIYPGQRQIEKFWGNLSNLFKPKSKKDGANAPLLGTEDRSPTFTSSDDDDSDEEGAGVTNQRRRPSFFPSNRRSSQAINARRYSTFPEYDRPDGPSVSLERGQGFKTAVTCMSSSVIIFILLAALELSARKKLHNQIAWVIFGGACSSLVFGLVGLLATLSLANLSKETPTDLHDEEAGLVSSVRRTTNNASKAIVCGIFLALCVGNGWLLASAISSPLL